MTIAVTVAFDALLRAVQPLDPICLLAHLTLRYLFVPADEFQPESADIHLHQTRIELLAGLLARRLFPEHPVEKITSADIDGVWYLLEEYFTAVGRELMAGMIQEESQPGDLNWVLFTARNHSLSIRGDAYRHQLQEMALSLYKGHDAWFRANLGFTIQDALTAATAVMALPVGWQKPQFVGFVDASSAQAVEASDLMETVAPITAEDFLGFTASELASVCGLPIEVTANVLRRLSQDFGYRNSRHPHTFEDPQEAPWDFNSLYERPFLHHEGRYWLFVPPLLYTALFKTFWFDLFSDGEYRETFNAARSRWLEQEVAQRLRRVFPPGSVLVNPTKGAAENCEELADIVVLHDRKVLIVQCKSKGLSQDARVGLDAGKLIADVRMAVAEAFEQGIGARSYLTQSQESVILHGRCQIHVPRDAVTGFYLLTVTPLPLQFFTTRLANHTSVGQLFSSSEFPWALSLADLDTITEVLGSPAQFLDYAGKRIKMERAPFRVHGDEMDMLGDYLSAGLRTDHPDFEGMTDVLFAGLSTNVDEYVWKRHDQGAAVEPPHQFSPPGFAELINDIERSGCLGATDCAMVLLDYGGTARVTLMNGIAEAKEKCGRTRKLQRVTMLMKNAPIGVCLLALDSKGDLQNLQRQLEAYAVLQKHVSRCHTWVGMAWDMGSARNVDTCLFLSEEWHPDADLDRLAARYLPSGR
jgi:hypothetical protein